MSHFRFPRTSRPIEQELMDTVTHPMEHQQHELEEMGSVHSESSSESTILAPRAPVVIERRCWICFGDSSDSQGRWVKPCGCTLEAHQSCLLDWIAENQKASPTKTVRCPQCSASYHLAQQGSLALALFTLLDSLTRTAAPYVAVLGLGCSVLITCTTFGAYTVMVMLGQREGERLIGNPNFWTWRTWIGLPLIPVLLISTRTRWANLVLPLATASYLRAAYERPHFRWLPTAFTYGIMPWFCVLYQNAYRFTQRYLTHLLATSPNDTPNERSERERTLEVEILQGRSSVSLSILGALLLPTFSSLMGGILSKSKWIRHRFPETLQRNMLGGCLFVVAKDIGNLIYKYEKIRQYRSRRVRSYEELHPRRHSRSAQP